MNVMFFGASVTKQKEGMCKVFANLNPTFKVEAHGYGGMYLKDAGMCFIDDALKTAPQYCIIDWFSTQLQNNDIEHLSTYLDTLIYKTVNANCIPIFLLLFRYDEYNDNVKKMSNERKIYYKKILKYAQKHNIPVIDLYNTVSRKKNKELILRDTVHTTPLGSELYGKLITKQFKLLTKQNINVKQPLPNHFCNIKKLTVNKKTKKGFSVSGKCDVVGIEQTVGPYSGIVTVNKEERQIWDRYCYYERNTITLDFNVNGKTKILITDKQFDRSSAKVQVNWNSYKKHINIINIYYIGSLKKIVML